MERLIFHVDVNSAYLSWEAVRRASEGGEDLRLVPAVIGGDPDQTKYLESGHVPTAKSYLDVLSSWSTNEYAIDYTGTAAYALSWFAKADLGITAAQLKLKRHFPPVEN